MEVVEDGQIFPDLRDANGHVYAIDGEESLGVSEKNGRLVIDPDGDYFDPNSLVFSDAEQAAFQRKVPRWICTVGNELGSQTHKVLVAAYHPTERL